jgi:NTP pyrophosphatase (non-canonical NTP hydrolase)
MSYKIQYLTAKLQEEAAEVIQAVSKINRFGPHNRHPDRTTTNLQELVGELEDFLAIVAALEHYQYIDLTLSQQQIANKAKALIQG